MRNFKLQQAILKYINKNGTISYSNATVQQLQFKNEDEEIITTQGEYGYWILFNENAYRIDENDLYINIEKLKEIKNTHNILQIENNSNNNLIVLDEPKICIKSEDISYTMFSYGKNKYFVKEKDLKVLENNYKDYEYKLYEMEEEIYIIAISIKREIVAIFKNNKLEEIELIGVKYENELKEDKK